MVFVSFIVHQPNGVVQGNGQVNTIGPPSASAGGEGVSALVLCVALIIITTKIAAIHADLKKVLYETVIYCMVPCRY